MCLIQLLELVFNGIALVPDVAHDFLQNILQCDHAAGAAEVVQNHGHLHFTFPKCLQRHRKTCAAVQEKSGGHQVADGGVRMDSQHAVSVIQIKNAGNGIHILVIDRQTGKGTFGHGLQNILPAVGQVDGQQVHPGRQDLFDGSFAEAHSGLQQLAAVLVDNAFILDSLDDGHQLVRRDRLRLRVAAP